MTKLAEQLSAIWAYRNTPDHPPEPIKSNWSTIPANDNAAVKDLRLTGEKLLKVTPSIEEILRNMAGDWVWKDGRLASIGKLKFSDGKMHEQALVRGMDGKVERKMVRVRANAMMGCTETLTDDAGGQGGAVSISNSTFADHFGVAQRQFIPSGKRRQGRSYTPAQSRALIAQAIANTPTLPPITKCPPGVASGTAQYSDQFIGMKIGSTGKGGVIHWVDLYSAGLEHDAWVAAAGSLASEDRETLDASMTAGSLAELGGAGHRRTRERQAVKRLKAANDNYLAALTNFAA